MSQRAGKIPRQVEDVVRFVDRLGLSWAMTPGVFV